MRFSLFAAAFAILSGSMLIGSHNVFGQEGQPQPQLTQEHIQIMRQIVQQMPQAQREELAKLPKEQQQQVLLALLARVLQPKPKPVKDWLEEDQDQRILFEEAERYPDTAERVEDFVLKKTERRIEVTELAFLREGHDHFFNYKRLFRVKYKTPKDDKEYVADFLLQKEGPYLEVKEWRRVKDERRATAG